MKGQLLFLLFVVYLSTLGAEVIFIKGGVVVNHDQEMLADVIIYDEVIKEVGASLQVPVGARVIEARGMYVMPGGIDPHTHLAMPFMGQITADDFFSGQSAALAGGTTMHIDFALPVNHDLLAGYDAWQEKAAKGVMDYGFHMAVTRWDDKVHKDMEELTKRGINSFKFFMAYKGSLQVSDEELLAGMSRCKELGALPQVHAENGDAVVAGQTAVFNAGITGPEGHALSRPAVLEGEATGRAIRLAHFVGVPLYVVHVMSEDAVKEIAAARQAGQRVVGEAVASGLACDESAVWDPDFDRAAAHVMSPPIRSKEHQRAVKGALSSGLLQIVGTDHAVFNSSQKAMGRHDFRLIPNGVNGIEERMHVLWEEMVNSGLMTRSQYVSATSTAAAQTFNIYPRKGHIAVGSDADIIILDPSALHSIHAATHHSAMDTNIYEGRKIQGKVVVTISRGRVVWANDQLNVTAGSSRYVHMPTNGALFEGLHKLSASKWQVPYGSTPVNRELTLKRDEL